MSEEDKAAVRKHRARGDRRLPRPRLPRTRADRPGAAAGDDGVAGLRAGARRVRADAARGDGARRQRRVGRSAAPDCRRLPGRRHRLRGIGAAGRHPPQGGRHPVHHRREERRRRRHLVAEHLSGRAGRRRKPLLLLQLRADRPVDALLRRTARAAGLLPARDGPATTSAATCCGKPRSPRRPGTTPPRRGPCGARGRDGATTTTVGARGDQRRSGS